MLISSTSMPNNELLEGAIVLEEFVKVCVLSVSCVLSVLCVLHCYSCFM